MLSGRPDNREVDRGLAKAVGIALLVPQGVAFRQVQHAQPQVCAVVAARAGAFLCALRRDPVGPPHRTALAVRGPSLRRRAL